MIAGNAELKPSINEFDWLGHGIYFWESDPRRALEYARWRAGRAELQNPAVVGAIIDLRQCLDLTNRQDLELVQVAYEEYVKEQKLAGLALPQNRSKRSDPTGDLLLRYLDCAVINHLHHMLAVTDDKQQMDTVRGMFSEGGALYPGAGFQSKSHTQIVVRNPECIIGYFKPPN